MVSNLLVPIKASPNSFPDNFSPVNALFSYQAELVPMPDSAY